MNNEYYGAPSTPNENFLAHYGIKGMKWGVRKAIDRGNDRALSRQYRKAEKKLAKLEKRAASGKKYAKRAALMGAGAAAAGGVAATGTRGISAAMRGVGSAGGTVARGLGAGALSAANLAQRMGIRGAGKLRAASKALYTAGNKTQVGVGRAANAVDAWGRSKDIGNTVNTLGRGKAMSSAVDALGRGKVNVPAQGIDSVRNKLGGMSNSGYTRLAGAALGAGLAAGAGYNAYRAATTKRAAKKAAQFRAEMNKAFAGTKYANGRPAGSKKRRR